MLMNTSKWFAKEKTMYLRTISKLQFLEPQTTHIYWGWSQIETNLFVQFGEPSNKNKS
jgi:hypothetical protein